MKITILIATCFIIAIQSHPTFPESSEEFSSQYSYEDSNEMSNELSSNVTSSESGGSSSDETSMEGFGRAMLPNFGGTCECEQFCESIGCTVHACTFQACICKCK